MNAPELENGAIIDGKYIVQRRIGAGAMGEIYLALQRPFMRRVALKMLHAWHVDSDEMSRRFMQEAEALARLNHPNTVTVFDFGRFENRHFIAMEFVEGMTVGDRIRAHGPLAPEDAIPLAIQVAQSLSEAHAKGIIHRDLKTDNILLSTPPGVAPFVKVVDFGIAKILDRRDGSLAGNILGTPHYMAPEQARGEREIGPAADIYSLGCCLYEMLTGEPPFAGSTAIEVMLKHQSEAPAHLPNDLPRSLDEVLRRTLAKNPADRPVDARTFIAELLECSTRLEEWRGNARVETTLDAISHPQRVNPTNPGTPPALRVGTPVAAPPRPRAENSDGVSPTRRHTFALIAGIALVSGLALFGYRSEPRRIHIDSSPRGALVELGGAPIGVTPLDLPAAAAVEGHGRLVKRGFLPGSFTLDDQVAGQLVINLEPAIVTLRLQAPIEGMQVDVDGTSYGRFSSAQRDLQIQWPEDDLRVVLRHPDYADYIEVVPQALLTDTITIAPTAALLVSRAKGDHEIPTN